MRTCAYQGVKNVSFRKILRTYYMNYPASASTKITSGDTFKTGWNIYDGTFRENKQRSTAVYWYVFIFFISKYVFCKLRQIVNFAKLGFHKLFHLIILINVFHKMKIKTESSVQTCPEKLFWIPYLVFLRV